MTLFKRHGKTFRIPEVWYEMSLELYRNHKVHIGYSQRNFARKSFAHTQNEKFDF